MVAYRRVYDSCHLQADCQELGLAPEPYARQWRMGYFYLFSASFESGSLHSVCWLLNSWLCTTCVVFVYVYDGVFLFEFLFRKTHTHTRFRALFPGLPGLACARKVKPIWILLKQETVSGSGISWAICKSAPCSRQITMPPLSFFSGRMPFLPPKQQRQSTEGNFRKTLYSFYICCNDVIIQKLFTYVVSDVIIKQTMTCWQCMMNWVYGRRCCTVGVKRICMLSQDYAWQTCMYQLRDIWCFQCIVYGYLPIVVLCTWTVKHEHFV